MNAQGEDDAPFMPHMAMTIGEMDEKFPAMKVQDEDPFMEPDQDPSDTVFMAGMAEAAEIEKQTRRCGRTRYEGMTRVKIQSTESGSEATQPPTAGISQVMRSSAIA